MSRSEKEFPVYITAFAFSLVAMFGFMAIGVLLKSENAIEFGTAFALASAFFLAGAIYWGYRMIRG